jgi:phosphodiesterase/alkaline phosphatase D-like protein
MPVKAWSTPYINIWRTCRKLRVMVWLAQGISYNSSTTLDHMIANEPDITLFVGDFVYADAWMTNGTPLDLQFSVYPCLGGVMGY